MARKKTIKTEEKTQEKLGVSSTSTSSPIKSASEQATSSSSAQTKA